MQLKKILALSIMASSMALASQMSLQQEASLVNTISADLQEVRSETEPSVINQDNKNIHVGLGCLMSIFPERMLLDGLLLKRYTKQAWHPRGRKQRGVELIKGGVSLAALKVSLKAFWNPFVFTPLFILLGSNVVLSNPILQWGANEVAEGNQALKQISWPEDLLRSVGKGILWNAAYQTLEYLKNGEDIPGDKVEENSIEVDGSSDPKAETIVEAQIA